MRDLDLGTSKAITNHAVNETYPSQACRKEGRGAGAPQILADQKAPPGGGGAPQRAALLPAPRIFDPWLEIVGE